MIDHASKLGGAYRGAHGYFPDFFGNRYVNRLTLFRDDKTFKKEPLSL